MYFITVDQNNVVTGVYDGSKDYVHRVTGEAISGAVQLPEGAISISDACYQCIITADADKECVWNGTQITLQPASLLENKKKNLLSALVESYTTGQVARIGTLTEAEVDAELGAL